jgi:two-component system cell cycle sensor histidine kinase/response regulator CckA
MVQATLPATVRIDQKISAVPPVPGDADQLNQVVVNLVTNSAQAVGAATGTITVGLDAVRGTKTGAQNGDTGWVRLWIADTGSGMNARTVERGFEPFFTTKKVGQGTGLGLSSCMASLPTMGAESRLRVSPVKARNSRSISPSLTSMRPSHYNEIDALTLLTRRSFRIASMPRPLRLGVLIPHQRDPLSNVARRSDLFAQCSDLLCATHVAAR